MVFYSCTRCSKVFYQKSNYVKHIGRKIPCNNITQNLLPIPPKVEKLPPKLLSTPPNIEMKNNDKKCKYCNIIFSRRDNLIRHMDKTCKEKDNEVIKLKEENDQLKRIIEINKDKNIIINNTTNNINNINNIDISNNIQNNIINKIDISNNIQNNNIIELVTFGQEEYELLTEAEKKDIIEGAMNSITNCIKHTHFNENKPQYMNVYINNIRSNLADVYEKGTWKKCRTDNITDMLISHSQRYIEKILHENKNNKNDYNKFLTDSTKYLIEDIDNDKNKVIRDQKQRIKITLYNEKIKVIKNKNKYLQ